MKQFKESPTNPEEGKKEWSEEYAPKEYIQQDWYDSIFNEIEKKRIERNAPENLQQLYFRVIQHRIYNH